MTRIAKTEITKAQAQKLTDRIKAAADQLWSLMLEAHDGKAWKALGYKTWEAYIGAEFDMSRRQSYNLLDQGRVIREIEAAAGESVHDRAQITVAKAKEIKPSLPEVTREIRDRVEKGESPAQATYEVIEARRVDAKPASTDVKKKESPVPATSNPGEVESLRGEVESLRHELQLANDNAAELAGLVESYDAVTAGEHAAAKEMAKVRAQLRTVEATRDQWMTTAGELRREVKALQRKLGAQK